MEAHEPAELMRRFKQALEHVSETGRLHPSDLQLPIQATPQTAKKLLSGYEGGSFDPLHLGVACIVVPPSLGRCAKAEGGWSLNPDGGPSHKKETAEAGLFAVRMSVRPHKGKSTPELPGRYYKFTLQRPPVDFLVQDEGRGNASSRDPFVLMHMRKRWDQTRVVVPVSTTAVDDAHTPADATPLSTATPDAGTEEVTGLIEHLSLSGAASNSDRGTGAGEGEGGTPNRALELKRQANQQFSAGEYLPALLLYSEAVELLEDAGEDAALATILCNRSVASLKSGRPAAALVDAERARALGGAKASYRLAEALSSLGLFEEALETYDAALATAQAGDMHIIRGRIEEAKRGRVEVRATPADFAQRLRRAAAGTTLLLAPGVYMGPFRINVEVRIVGGEGVVFDSTGTSTLLVCCAGRVVLESLDVRHSAGTDETHALCVMSGAVLPPSRSHLLPRPRNPALDMCAVPPGDQCP